MEPFHIRSENDKDDDYNEPEEIFDLLPQRFREISSHGKLQFDERRSYKPSSYSNA